MEPLTSSRSRRKGEAGSAEDDISLPKAADVLTACLDRGSVPRSSAHRPRVPGSGRTRRPPALPPSSFSGLELGLRAAVRANFDHACAHRVLAPGFHRPELIIFALGGRRQFRDAQPPFAPLRRIPQAPQLADPVRCCGRDRFQCAQNATCPSGEAGLVQSYGWPPIAATAPPRSSALQTAPCMQIAPPGGIVCRSQSGRITTKNR